MNKYLLFILIPFIAFYNCCVAQNVDLSGGSVFEGEPFMAIDPVNPQHIVIAWMGTVTVYHPTIKIITTFNGGVTWSTPVVLPHQVAAYISTDVSIVFDHSGNVYTSYMDYRESPASGGVYMVRSTDGGVTWGTATLVLDIAADGTKYPIDLPRLAIKRTSGAIPDTMYLTTRPAKWVAPPNRCYYMTSDNYGITWSSWQYIDTTGYLIGPAIKHPFADPAIDSGGGFQCVYNTFVPSASPDVRFILATGLPGNTFNYNVAYTVVGEGYLDTLDKAFAHFICDPTNTRHFALFCIENLHGDPDVFCVETTDGGATWGLPVRVNDDAVSNGRMQDMVWANFDEFGDIISAWRDRRNAPDSGYDQPTEIWGAIKWKDSLNFSANFKISDTAAQNAAILDQPGNEFLNVTMAQDTMSVVWGDVRPDTVLNIWFERKCMKLCTPPPATITPSGATTVCAPATVILNANAGTGLTYQWELAGAAIAGATNITYTATITGTYNVKVYNSATCDSVSLPVVVTINPLPVVAAISGFTSVCAGANITLTDVTAGGTWSSSGATATVTSGGVVHGVSAGTDTIKYSVTNSCGTVVAIYVITINLAPVAGTISGPITVCTSAVITLTDAAPGGSWTSSNGSATVAGGDVTGVSAGTDTISYSVTNSCGTAVATYNITVSAGPAAITPAAAIDICLGTIVTLSDITPGGSWASSLPGTASVTAGGVVTGNALGTATINYTIGSCSVSKIVTVLAAPAAISPPSPVVCVGSILTLTDAAGGGIWSSTVPGTATISATGIVTGVASGTTTISYIIGTCFATTIVTVNPLPAAGVISGTVSSICGTTTTTLTDIVAGGVWSAGNSFAAVSATGVVTGISAGTDTISYSVTNSCGTASATYVITVNSVPNAGSITGLSTVCTGTFITLSDIIPGGLWTSSNGNATVAAGVVTGISAGTDTISYSVTNSCGTAVATNVITITTGPAAITPAGVINICLTTTIGLSDIAAGGIWSSTLPATASVTAGGIVTGNALGVATISYTIGSCSATKLVTVVAAPSTIVPLSPVVCAGATVSLSDGVGGGVWSSITPGIATVSATGVVTGVATGTATISYTIGTCFATTIVTVDPAPDAGVISGPTGICGTTSISLTETIAGGVWSATNGNATVSAIGVVTGVSLGTDLISYSVTNSCGIAVATTLITIDSIPDAGMISGTDGVCVGSAITLLESVTGGTWVAGNATATVLAPGVIFGVTPGIDTIFYVVTNSCGTADAYKIIPVNPVPVIALVGGPSVICIGTIATLSDDTTGGSWISSNPAIATIDVLSGMIHGIAAGTVTITYTVTNGLGCPASVTYSITVDAVPILPAITGPTHECIGATVTLTDATAGGAWNSSNSAIASIGVSGALTGVSAGIVTISYSVANVCGVSAITAKDTVAALPVVNAIAAATSECVGATATLTDATGGGVWVSTNITIAAVNPSTGVVTGVAAGNVAINYTVTNGAGCSASVTTINTVNPLPLILPVTGVTNECLGATTVLADATPGGSWSSSNTIIATINTSGLVSGISNGIATISYSLTNSFGCLGAATIFDTVNTTPVKAAITGVMAVCSGATGTLADAILWGVWTSITPTIATISYSSGIVTGLSAGTDIIVYSVLNSCGSVKDTAIITVYASPSVSPVSGPSISVCAGATTILSDANAGGSWSSSNTAIATVGNTTGVVSNIAAGNVIITYTVTNTNGCMGYATYSLYFGGDLGTSSVQPAAAIICDGYDAYMHVLTSASGLTYQWMRNNVIIPGATNYGYTAGLTGNYSVVISNSICEEILAGTVVSIMSNPMISFSSPNMLYTGSYSGYQWYRNGVAIPGATSSIYFETEPGGYSVEVSDANGCTATASDYTITGGIGSGVSIIGNNNNISIYPNPASTVLYIESPQTVDLKILFIDGRTAIEQASAKEINVRNLADGMYIIMLYDKDGLLVKTDKFVKRD